MRMRLLSTVLISALMVVGRVAGGQAAATQSEFLWYAQPAAKWTAALPIGNGQMGAMVFGGVTDERIQFNEDTLWKGKPHGYARAGAHDHLAEVRELLFQGKTSEAADLTRQTLLSD